MSRAIAAAGAWRNDGRAFEYYSMEYHLSKYAGHIAWHSSVIPEEELFAAGIFHNYNARRMMRNAHFRAQSKAGVVGSPYVDDGVDFLIKRPALDPSKAPAYHAAQAKNYAKRYVSPNDLAGFYRNMMIMRSPGYLYTTSPLEIRLREDLMKDPDMYKHERLVFDAAAVAGVAGAGEQPRSEVLSELRGYQREAIDALIARLSQDAEPHKMILHIGCGLGKTLIAGNLFSELKQYRKPELYVCIAPLRVSVANLKDRLMPFFNATASCSSAQPFRALLVDSDTGGTTDVAEIGAVLKTREPTVIFATFESFFRLLDVEFGEYLNDEDAFLLVDEMHNLTAAECRVVNKYHTSLLMSATVPEPLLDVLDATEAYRYTMADGIANGYLCDYEVILPLIKRATPALTPTEGDAAIEGDADGDTADDDADGEADREHTVADVDVPDGFPRDDVTAKALFLCTGMLQTGSRRCIAYLSSTDECSAFVKTLSKICEEYHGIRLWCETMDYTIGTSRRAEILRDFQADSPAHDFYVIASIRILDEAVDIPRCDSEFIAHVGDCTSDIRTVQRLQRGGRLDPSNRSKKNHLFMWCDEWSRALNALTIMRQEDPVFYKKLRVLSTNYDQLGVPTVQRQSQLRTEEIQAYAEVRCLTLSELWERRRQNWQNMRERLGRDPSKTAEQIDEKRIGVWGVKQRTAYNTGNLSDERVRALNNTPGWSWSGVPDWEKQRQNWQNMRERLGRDPNQTAEQLDERRAAMWCHNQRTAYKKGQLSDERVLALENTPGWTWRVRSDWEHQRQIWQNMAQQLGRDPNQTAEQLDERRAAKWCDHQRTAYKKGQLSDERIRALENTPGWVWSRLKR